MFYFDRKWSHKKVDIEQFLFSHVWSLYNHNQQSILSLFCCFVRKKEKKKKVEQNALACLPTQRVKGSDRFFSLHNSWHKLIDNCHYKFLKIKVVKYWNLYLSLYTYTYEVLYFCNDV